MSMVRETPRDLPECSSRGPRGCGACRSVPEQYLAGIESRANLQYDIICYPRVQAQVTFRQIAVASSGLVHPPLQYCIPVLVSGVSLWCKQV